MASTEEKSTKQEISKHEFYFETPLYEIIKNETLEENIFDGDVDAYSAQNSIDTTFTISYDRVDGQYESNYESFYKVKLTCKRKGNDTLRFFLIRTKEWTVKVGQFPSLADIQFAEVGKKYDKLLNKEGMKEFKRAIGLAAHGVGAGSFVYLRRIFEKLIIQTFAENKAKLDIPEKDFIQKRMVEKVEILKKQLPSQLVEMKQIYAILSKGVHELEEQECLQYFPVLKLSIELILEQKIEIETKNKRDVEVKKQVESISKTLKSADK